MIERYLTQAAIWKRVTGRTPSGQPVTSSTTTPVRWEWTRRLVRSVSGEEVVSEGRVFTTAKVKTGDSLVDPDRRAWTVLDVSVMYGMGGGELYREASV